MKKQLEENSASIKKLQDQQTEVDKRFEQLGSDLKAQAKTAEQLIEKTKLEEHKVDINKPVVPVKDYSKDIAQLTTKLD